jgi:hypothetical protein
MSFLLLVIFQNINQVVSSRLVTEPGCLDLQMETIHVSANNQIQMLQNRTFTRNPTFSKHITSCSQLAVLSSIIDCYSIKFRIVGSQATKELDTIFQSCHLQVAHFRIQKTI